MEQIKKVVWQDGANSKAVKGCIVDDDIDSITVQTSDGARFKIFKRVLICIQGDNP